MKTFILNNKWVYPSVTGPLEDLGRAMKLMGGSFKEAAAGFKRLNRRTSLFFRYIRLAVNLDRALNYELPKFTFSDHIKDCFGFAKFW